ncbi:hypothetical protein Dsin_016543 [Dipteronia sinensis]|uniref:G domain-containing protein n=1 Tax=Dipteronia sinensis TaxID=43782 RepID=A0AAE0E5U7_9ROSI|nr:hypothetical protein Dsin_016543 [Dipteronia sinensis]
MDLDLYLKGPTPDLTDLYKTLVLLDLPGIIEGDKDGKCRGRQVISRFSTARTSNCILIVLDARKPITQKRLIKKELEGFGIRSMSLKTKMFRLSKRKIQDCSVFRQKNKRPLSEEDEVSVWKSMFTG